MPDTHRLTIKIGIVILAIFFCLTVRPTRLEFALVAIIVLAILLLWRGKRKK